MQLDKSKMQQDISDSEPAKVKKTKTNDGKSQREMFVL
jgi:hypothetical protein